MIKDLDFKNAILSGGPELVRDGGSVLIYIEVNNQKFSVRYAGGLADVLSDQEGKLEFKFEMSGNKNVVFIDAKKLDGWKFFIRNNRHSLANHEEKFLGLFQAPTMNKASILKAFKRSI